MEIPFTRSFGVRLSGAVKDFALQNGSQTATNDEQADDSGKIAKLGIFVSRFALGGGIDQRTLRITSIDVNKNYTTTTLSDSSPIIFAEINYDFNQHIRFMLEAQYETGTLGSYNSYTLSGGLRAFILLPP